MHVGVRLARRKVRKKTLVAARREDTRAAHNGRASLGCAIENDALRLRAVVVRPPHPQPRRRRRNATT
eukprot:11188619-Lingulodinium_polyedra.AAC.1